MRLKDHLNKIEYFTIVAEEGSIAKASQRALVGQPQLTKVIKQLEDILERQLLVRTPKGVNLTKEGSLLYDYGKKILDQVSEAEFLIQASEKTIKGTVHIGTYDSIARYFFPEFLKFLKANSPEIHITLKTGRSANMIRDLSKKELDIVIAVKPEKIPRSLQHNVIYEDSFGLYKNAQLPSSFEQNLIYFPFPMNETDKAMGRFGFRESICCDNLETVKSLAEQSLGVGLLPHRVARESVLARKLIPFHHPKIKNNSFDFHEIVVCWNHSEDQTHVFVLDEIERFLKTWSTI